MKCTDVRAQLQFLFPQNCEEIEDSEIRNHLATCSSCRQELQELEQLGKLLATNPEPRVAVDLVSLYRRAAVQEARTSRRWRWMGLSASLFLLMGGVVATLARLEVRVSGQELVLRWGIPPASVGSSGDSIRLLPEPKSPTNRREEQLEVLSAMVRAMVEELQTVELRQRRDRDDLDIRVSGLQEQTLERWFALQKDMEALYVLTHKGE